MNIKISVRRQGQDSELSRIFGLKYVKKNLKTLNDRYGLMVYVVFIYFFFIWH